MTASIPVLRSVSDRLFPPGANRYGPLPALLVPLTFVTGLVDAVSYLGLGHVFVANMTGNVAFLGFSLAGAKSLSLWASALAIAAFVVGAWSESRIARLLPAGPVGLFRVVVAAHAVLVACAAAVAFASGATHTGTRAALIALLGCGMGLQNAVVRKLAVPDLTTTVLTLTVTGLASDRPERATARRLLSVAAILAGALTGAALELHAGAAWALGTAALVLAAVAAVPAS
ncbi:YoaK family protein [Streptacidiphilus anmyonensis]|uniref:YoaK family protein n=1 Tax=Streptacidiphilus anmyonensis TaxID=405782 RepID=UPI0005A74413|nr:YoaK family protein [Streptacidiphilus anmyonensis]